MKILMISDVYFPRVNGVSPGALFVRRSSRGRWPLLAERGAQLKTTARIADPLRMD
mgnify:CR=1 FL=1